MSFFLWIFGLTRRKAFLRIFHAEQRITRADTEGSDTTTTDYGWDDADNRTYKTVEASDGSVLETRYTHNDLNQMTGFVEIDGAALSENERLDFDGVDDRVSFGSADSSKSISFWVRPDAWTGTVMSHGYQYGFAIELGYAWEISMYYGGSVVQSWSAIGQQHVQCVQWYHVVVTHDGPGRAT